MILVHYAGTDTRHAWRWFDSPDSEVQLVPTAATFTVTDPTGTAVETFALGSAELTATEDFALNVHLSSLLDLTPGSYSFTLTATAPDGDLSLISAGILRFLPTT